MSLLRISESGKREKTTGKFVKKISDMYSVGSKQEGRQFLLEHDMYKKNEKKDLPFLPEQCFWS